ncbi:MAG: CRISPR-associated protein Cas4, partial [Bacteroidaceae bacterium]|nr:CRISPR-associated protein Cas4 [Bacteroidaceae bacterium]
EDMLMLSGVQHFVFCPRQWALIHMDQQWAENALTAEGNILHKKVDDPTLRQLNNSRITLRSVRIASATLGLNGITDAVELIPTDNSDNSISHPKYSGRFIPRPVEYKRGHHKTDECDTMQLVCQAMCLEEMHNIRIGQADLFYWEVRRRENVQITDELREKAIFCAHEMHRVMKTGILPPASFSPKCKRCSLYDICMPETNRLQPVASYLKDCLYEETT